MKKRGISILFLILLLFSFLLTSCNQKSTEASLNLTDSAISTKKVLEQNFIDSIIFLGESTTYHMKSRGVLSGGTQTTQIWAPKSGTLMLDSATSSCRIVYPETGEEIDLCEAMRRKKPEYMLLTFGLNGASRSISRGSEYFKSCYAKLIRSLQEASPDTGIIIQSCFPIAKSMDMSEHSVDSKTLNEYIDIINGWSEELALTLNIPFIYSASVLKNSDGFLFEEYHVGDGYHLTREAYVKILEYIKANADIG